MLTDFDLNLLIEPLLSWYDTHARVLPWREDVTPYRVWVSEVMLQQTRVEAVKPYFKRFVDALPTVEALADCEEDRLLKLWEGLGYYNRVRNMQKAARVLTEDYGGELPADPALLRALPGIGSYTAGAIASIAYNKPVPAVDGNVLRILMRVTADDADIMRTQVRREAEQRLSEILPADRPSAFNQALMELGATVCLPNGEPLCADCPWHALCEGRRRNLTAELPVRKKPPKRRIEERTILLLRDDESIVLRKRPETGLLAGMYELPGAAGHLSADEVIRETERMGLHPLRVMRLADAKHVFSHVEWHMWGYLVQVDSLTREESDMLFVKIADLREKYPLPSAFASYLPSV